MNYIKIVNWFWEEVPYFEGYKAAHVSLFFAVLDSINRNKWQQTRIGYEYLVAKCKLAKRSYLESRDWLIKNRLIEIIPGQNAYYMASFNLGSAVQKCTTNDTAIGTTNETTTAPLSAPLTAPLSAPINNKHINVKHLNNKQTPASPVINFSFEEFWILYDKKVGNKTKLEKKWNGLTDEEREKAIYHIPLYKQEKSNKQFRKNPETYLNNKAFNDEVIIESNQLIKNSYHKNNNHEPANEFGFEAWKK